MRRVVFSVLAALALFFCAQPARAQGVPIPGDSYGFCYNLAVPQTISASCTVTFFDAGTSNLSTGLFRDEALTVPFTNPGAAGTNGTWRIYVAAGTTQKYDIRISGGVPALTPYTINNVGIALPPSSPTNIICVDGTTYMSIAAAVAALPGAGGIVCTPQHYRETFTSQIDLGSATKPVTLQMYPDTILTCNVNDITKSCLVVHNGGAIIGINEGNSTSTNGSTGGATIIVASSAVVNNVITNGEKGAGGQAYAALRNFLVYGSDGGLFGTVNTAMINFEAVLNQTAIDDVKVMQFKNTIGIRLASNASSVAGPFLLKNVWVEGGQTGARPLVYSCVGSTLVGGQIIGGIFNFPGNTDSNIEITGDTGGAQRCRDLDISTYIESSVGASTGINITNWGNVNIHGTEVQLLGTAVSISETGVQLTKNITISGLRTTGAAIVAVANTVTSENFGTSSLYLPSWSWAGDGGFQDALPVYVTTGGTSNVNDGMVIGAFGALANRSTEVVITPSGTRAPLLIRNYANAGMNTDVSDTGASAAEIGSVRWLDRGSPYWAWEKNASNVFVLRDSHTGDSREVVNSGGETDIYSRGSGTIALNNVTGGGTGGFRVYSGGATPVLWWYVDSSGFNQRDATGTNNVFAVTQTGVATARNYLDSTLELFLDDGLTASQDLGISMNDRGTTEWRVRKSAAQQFVLTDQIDGQNRMVIPQVADVADDGLLRAANNENIICAEANPTGTDGCLKLNATNQFETAVPLDLTIATGTAPLVVASTTPVANLAATPTTYNHSGTQQTNAHDIVDSCTLGTDCAVTLAGAAVYTSSTSYTCLAQDQTAAAATKVVQSAGNAFTITGTGTDSIRYHCSGK